MAQRKGDSVSICCAPDKHTIYGEYFPSRFRQVGTQSRLDQLLTNMKGSAVQILDLRGAMISAKAKGQLYFKTDTHWNSYGGAIAQYEIMQCFSDRFPSVQPIRYGPEDFAWMREGDAVAAGAMFFWTDNRAGDIANMLNLAHVLKEEMYPILQRPLRQYSTQYFGQPNLSATFLTSGPRGAPRAIIFRDSFFMAVAPYTSQYFSKCLYVWRDLEMGILEPLVKQFSPDIVIDERAERMLPRVPPAFRP